MKWLSGTLTFFNAATLVALLMGIACHGLSRTLATFALLASVLTFSLYYPVVRRIGPAKAAYFSVIVPIIAMGFSTALEGYRWTPTTIAGALLALGGMAAALGRDRSGIAAPDAA